LFWNKNILVLHVLFDCIETCNLRRLLTRIEALAMIVGCFCHDLDHRGTNNAFQQKSVRLKKTIHVLNSCPISDYVD